MSYNKYLSPPPTQQIKIRNTSAVELGDQLFVVFPNRIPDKTRKGKSVDGFYFTFEWKVDSGGTGAKKLDHCYHHQVFSCPIPSFRDG